MQKFGFEPTDDGFAAFAAALKAQEVHDDVRALAEEFKSEMARFNPARKQ